MSDTDIALLLCRIHWKGLHVQGGSESDLISKLRVSLAAFEKRMSLEFKTSIHLTRCAFKSDLELGSLFYAYWSPHVRELSSDSVSTPFRVTDEEILNYQEALKTELNSVRVSGGDDSVDLSLSRLSEVMNLEGAKDQGVTQFHYVVETDVENGWLEEVSRWYDIEHMPGLSQVPGCVNAKRYINLDSGPYSLACYDLLAPEVLGCPEWLAVRGTAWSDVARPHFINTRRNMFKVV